MHRNHLAPCLAVAALGFALVLATGADLAGLAVVLLCPLLMGGMMLWMARR